jgi:hypothetical protein
MTCSGSERGPSTSLLAPAMLPLLLLVLGCSTQLVPSVPPAAALLL